jgi:hypothetical protein
VSFGSIEAFNAVASAASPEVRLSHVISALSTALTDQLEAVRTDRHDERLSAD